MSEWLIAFEQAKRRFGTALHVYIINLNHKIPILQFITENQSLFSTGERTKCQLLALSDLTFEDEVI